MQLLELVQDVGGRSRKAPKRFIMCDCFRVLLLYVLGVHFLEAFEPLRLFASAGAQFPEILPL